MEDTFDLAGIEIGGTIGHDGQRIAFRQLGGNVCGADAEDTVRRGSQQRITLFGQLPTGMGLVKSKDFKEEQLQNIQLISLTLLVLKLDKFKEVKEEH